MSVLTGWTPKTLQRTNYASAYYGVPADVGVHVSVNGRLGTIVRVTHYLWVQFDDAPDDLPIPCHPTWNVSYLEARAEREGM